MISNYSLSSRILFFSLCCLTPLLNLAAQNDIAGQYEWQYDYHTRNASPIGGIEFKTSKGTLQVTPLDESIQFEINIEQEGNYSFALARNFSPNLDRDQEFQFNWIGAVPNGRMPNEAVHQMLAKVLLLWESYGSDNYRIIGRKLGFKTDNRIQSFKQLPDSDKVFFEINSRVGPYPSGDFGSRIIGNIALDQETNGDYLTCVFESFFVSSVTKSEESGVLYLRKK